MKVVSVKKKDLVDALGQMTHAGFAVEDWSWQVIFDPKDTQAEGRVVLVNPDTDHEVNYRLVNEEGYNALQFADLNGFTWDSGVPLSDLDLTNIKALDQIRLDKATRAFIEQRLRQHVTLDRETFHVEYY